METHEENIHQFRVRNIDTESCEPGGCCFYSLDVEGDGLVRVMSHIIELLPSSHAMTDGRLLEVPFELAVSTRGGALIKDEELVARGDLGEEECQKHRVVLVKGSLGSTISWWGPIHNFRTATAYEEHPELFGEVEPVGVIQDWDHWKDVGNGKLKGHGCRIGGGG